MAKIIHFLGGENPPQRISFRLLTTSTRLAALFIVPAYSGAILSFILHPVVKLPFNNVKEFVEDGSYQLGYPALMLNLFFLSRVRKLNNSFKL